MQGVSINLFVKTGKKKQDELGEIFHYDLYGKRDFKYDFLNQNLNDLKWNNLKFEAPYYFYVPKDFGEQTQYEKGFKIDKLFNEYNTGIQTKRDKVAISFNDDEANR